MHEARERVGCVHGRASLDLDEVYKQRGIRVCQKSVITTSTVITAFLLCALRCLEHFNADMSSSTSWYSGCHVPLIRPPSQKYPRSIHRDRNELTGLWVSVRCRDTVAMSGLAAFVLRTTPAHLSPSYSH